MKYGRRHKKKVFSEREKDAIIRLSQAKVETKAYPVAASLLGYLTDTNYVAGTGAWAWGTNVFAGIPTTNSSNTAADDHSFLGNDIQARGLRWEGTFWSGDGVTTPGANYDTWFRFTVYEIPDYLSGNHALVAGAAQEYDPDFPMNPIIAKWNMDYVKLRFQKTWKLDNNGSLNALTRRKFYIPIQRKIEKSTELADTVGAMGIIKGLQVYWALEVFSPGNTGNLGNFISGAINTLVYFKDA